MDSANRQLARPIIRYLSVCSGIEAATAAWHALGWQAAGFSEIESFARAVLAHHYPDVPLHGDFTKLRDAEHGAIDLLVGGTPCQSFSIAGLRKGLDDDRGNLTLEYIRLAERLRPRWLVWENVPGVLSIDGGRTFGAFLGGLAECGYGFAYRILDAQYFGVPQRRRRVFVVGHLGDWRPAAAVLFEREGLCGDITPGGKAREGIAGTITSGAGRRRGGGQQPESLTAHTLNARCGSATEDGTGRGAPLLAGTLKGGSGSRGWPDPSDGNGGGLIAHTLRGDGFDASEDGTGRGTPLVAGTVSSKWAKGTGGPSGDECQNLIAFSAKDYGADADECAPTLRAMCHAESHQNGGGQIAVAIPLQEIGKRTGKSTDDASIGIGIGGEGDAMFTLQAGAQHGVASFKPGQSAESRGIGYDDRLSPSLEAGGGGNNRPAVMQHMAVRRLTPRECERLQGFPDDYTLIPYRGKPAADGPRYKALGNSMAVPVMRWLGERIQKIERQVIYGDD